MSYTSSLVLLWAPRILGLAVSVFIGLFALDALAEGKPIRHAVPDFLLHLLPALGILAVVALSWRRAWVRAVAFLSLAVLYAAAMSRGRLDWILAISGPLFMVGTLFLWSWVRRAARQS